MSAFLLENNVGLLTTEDSTGWLLLEGYLATIASESIKRAGLTPTYAAASVGGDRFVPDSQTFLHVKNGGGSPITVTVTATGKVDSDLALGNLVVTVANASEKMIGPFPAQLFVAADGSGLADVAYSAVTSVTVAAIRLNQP